MDREGFKARLGAYYDSSTHTDSDPSFLCLVLMVLAMGSQFAELQGPRRPAPPGPSTVGGPGTVFYLKAKVLLSDVVTQCSLESIQACFLMGLFLLPSNISDLSYVYHGMALKMAISAGLHRKVSGANLDQKITSVRNRLWWSLYTSERLVVPEGLLNRVNRLSRKAYQRSQAPHDNSGPARVDTRGGYRCAATRAKSRTGLS